MIRLLIALPVAVVAVDLLAILFIHRANRVPTPKPGGRRPVSYVPADHALVTSQGVEIPVAWLKGSTEDLDAVVATIYEIDALGTPDHEWSTT